MYSKRFLICIAIVATFIFFVSYASADDRSFSYGTYELTKHGGIGDRDFSFIDYDSSVDAQVYKFDSNYNFQGYGSAGKVRIDACISNGVTMWSGACWVLTDFKYGERQIVVSGISKQLGDLTDTTDYNYVNFHVRVDDATVFLWGSANYRKVWGQESASKTKVKVGEPFTVNWEAEWAVGGVELITDGAVGKGSANLAGSTTQQFISGTKTFTASSPGFAYFTLKPIGPGNNGIYTPEYGLQVEVEPVTSTQTCQDPGATNFGGPAPCTYPPGYVSLNFNVSDNCNASPVTGAGVTITKDFGNGTTRTTDGSGFANFGALKDSGALGWTVTANGYNTSSGNTSIGSVDVNVPVSLTRDCAAPPPPPTTTSPPPPPPGFVNLNISTSGSGTVTTNDGKVCSGLNTTCTFQYPENSTPELSATPGTNWAFTSWSGGCGTIIGNTCYMGMTQPKSVTATFSQTTQTRILTVSKSGSGSIASEPAGISCGTACSANFALNSIVTLTATPGPGLGVTWSSGCNSTQGNVCSVTMDANKTVTAAFTIGTGTITVSAKDIADGSAVNTNWTLCYGGFCNQSWSTVVDQQTGVSSKTYTGMSPGQYDLVPLIEGTTHKFHHFDIKPPNQFLNSGSTLSYVIWYEKKTSVTPPACSANPSSVQINQSTTLSASGGTGSYTWSAPGGTLSATSGTNVSASYSTTGTKTVTVTSGTQSGSCTVNVSSVPVGKVKVRVHKQGSGSGTVTAANINCGSICEFDYNFGDVIGFSHSESSPSTWGGWSGACTDFNNCVIDMRPEGSIKDLYATLNTPVTSGTGRIAVTTDCNHVYTITKSTGGSFGGAGNMTFENKPTGTYTIDWEPKPVTTVNQQTQTLQSGQTITFSLSSTACTGGGNQEQQPTTAEAVCSVNVTPRYTLTVAKTGSGSGTVTASGINCGSDCSETYNDGTVVAVSANPSAGSTFTGWTGACSGNAGCSITMNSDKSVTAIFNSAPTVSNVNVTEPDYCVSGPAATVNWTYSDPGGSPQLAYQVQIDEQGSFNSPEVDTGKVNSNSNSYFTGQGALQFNVTYRARVRVWNSFDQVSSWTESGSWKTPNYAYPQVDFSWTPANPSLNSGAQFTDQTVFGGNPNGRRWNWIFGDGGSSAQQNPSHTYNTEGTYYTTLSATDNANQSCSRTKGPIRVQKPVPIWKEIAPR